MQYDIHEAIAVLERTPGTLRSLLAGLPAAWLNADEGPDTFTPIDVVGHLIDGERDDWIQRMHIILEHGEARPFDPYDRFAFRERYAGVDLAARLDRFEADRGTALQALRDAELGPQDLERRGTHPELGQVTLGQLLATWVVHDLNHLAQIARAMAKRYGEDVGPWGQYLPILSR